MVSADGTELTGTGEIGTTVTVTDADGFIVGTGTVGAGGTFAIDLDPPQADGASLSVVLEDAAGNVSQPGTATTTDGTPPDAPTNLVLTAGGTILTGAGEIGATVTVTNAAGDTVGTGTVGAGGTFSITFAEPQNDGGDLSVVLSDAAGNDSLPGTVGTVDLTGPTPPTDLEVNASGTLIGGGGEPGATVTVTNAAGDVIGTGTVAADGTFEIGLSPAQVDGGELDVVLTDGSGNDSPTATVDAPDLVAPLAPTDLLVNAAGTILTGEGRREPPCASPRQQAPWSARAWSPATAPSPSRSPRRR
ncbi:Ig-like domain-containing protein [Aliirhizobium terrae]|uniref:Ig-like domain-containing protein n=1 Tax=Terrirhizobium terrae TaxID=2926709 RepID=UPI002575DF5F|nr:Ig-like domain-containing protein [Rhizobium sp. CC-CFT758]WJH41719.1 Ig-like domain-containing protein [Rhizobium sp. CC-CFT758]